MSEKTETHLGFSSAVIDVPRKGRQLHGQDHLRTRHFHRLIAKPINGTNDMASNEWLDQQAKQRKKKAHL